MPSERQKMKSMTELAGGELCLPQQPYNQEGAARRKVKDSERERHSQSRASEVSYLARATSFTSRLWQI